VNMAVPVSFRAKAALCIQVNTNPWEGLLFLWVVRRSGMGWDSLVLLSSSAFNPLSLERILLSLLAGGILR
jgi:hypothetical protein